MNKKIKIIVFILSLTLLSNKCNVTYENYKPNRQELDKNVPPKEMKLIEEVTLEETEELVLHDILMSDINNSCSILAVTDETNRTLNFYNYENGKILNFIKADLWLVDSIIASGIKPYNHFNKTYKYLNIKDYPNYKITPELTKLLLNTFMGARFVNDSTLIVSALLNAWKTTIDSNNLFDISNALVYCDINGNIKKFLPLESSSNLFPTSIPFFYNSQTKTIIMANEDSDRKIIQRKLDSIITFSIYDSVAHFIKQVSFLPETFTKSFLNNLEFSKIPQLCFIKDSCFISYGIDLTIYNLNNEKRFQLKNLPFKNDSGFLLIKEPMKEMYENSSKVAAPTINDSGFAYQSKISKFYISRVSKNKITRKIYDNLFPVKIANMINTGGTLTVWLYVIDSTVENGYYYILQEYTTEGKLLSQTNLFDKKEQKIRHIAYDSKHNYILIFLKSKEGWKLEKRKWS